MSRQRACLWGGMRGRFGLTSWGLILGPRWSMGFCRRTGLWLGRLMMPSGILGMTFMTGWRTTRCLGVRRRFLRCWFLAWISMSFLAWTNLGRIILGKRISSMRRRSGRRIFAGRCWSGLRIRTVRFGRFCGRCWTRSGRGTGWRRLMLKLLPMGC